MKITKRQLRRIIREAVRRSPSTAERSLAGPSETGKESFSLAYRGFGYRNRRIIGGDKAWLEFVPQGSPSLTNEDMFRAVTLLDNDDPEISKALNAVSLLFPIRPLESYDVYSVYATTTG